MTNSSSTIDSLACVAVKLVAALACRLPTPFAYWLGRRFGDVARLAKPDRAHIAYVNLAFAFGERYAPRERLRIIRRHFQYLGEGLVEMLRLPLMDRAYVDRYIQVDGRRWLDEAIARGRGVILLTGHFGNWELSSIVAALKGYPILALAREQKYPKLDRLLKAYREAKGCRIVPKGMALRAMVRALHEDQIVGIVADQDAGRNGIFLELFGRPASTAPGPVAMAMRTGATVLPVFIRRERGPYHRITLEPPLALTGEGEEAERCGLEQFVRHLERHVTATPDQWLWAHKRWKSTPVKTALVLSDGKAGHLKQSLAVVKVLRWHRPDLRLRIAEARFASPWRRCVLTLQSRWLRSPIAVEAALSRALTRETMAELRPLACDVVISCGASMGAVNLLVGRASRAKTVTVMRPSLVSLRRFDRVIVPAHDGVRPRPNVVVTQANLTSLDAEELQRGAERLRASTLVRGSTTNGHRPRIGLLLGGDTDDFHLGPELTRRVVDAVVSACETLDAECWVTTSRRTSPATEAVCTELLERQPRCRWLVIANRVNPEGAVEGLLGTCEIIVVSGESTSMVSEAVASGRRVIVFVPERLHDRQTKHERLLEMLQQRGHLQIVSAEALPQAIADAHRSTAPVPTLSDRARLQEALARLF